MIYLATPYSHPDPLIREERFRLASITAGYLMQQGLIVFSPIAHTHPIASLCSLPLGWEYWHKFDIEFITLCEKLIVVKMIGWEESHGIREEIKIAESLNKPFEYMEVPFNV
jgi:hypothetical protein